MLNKIQKILKVCAYIFLIGNIGREAYHIAISTSYLNTGELMGVESMIMMLWSCFMSFLFALIIYGFAEIIEYYENAREKNADDLTKSDNDVK